MPLNNLAERTEVLYGTDKVISVELQFFSKSKRQVDTCMDSTRPSFCSKSFSGAGLYISKNIIEAHGGKIWL